MTFSDESTRTRVYNKAGDVIAFTDGNGSVFQNTFDALGRKTGVAITPAIGVAPTTTSQSFCYDGLSRPTYAEDGGAAGTSSARYIFDSLGRTVEESQTFSGHTRNVTHAAFQSTPTVTFTFPNGRQTTDTFDALYRRTQITEAADGTTIAARNFFGPSRVAEITLGNGLVCTWMNNARTRSAVQTTLANPGWGDSTTDRLGYDGAGRMIAKRYLVSSPLPPGEGQGEGVSPGEGQGEGCPATSALLGFTTEFDAAGNKLYERHLHAENRSHVYEPFSLVSGSYAPQGGYDSADRLLQYQRGTLDGTVGFSGQGGGAISTPIALSETDSQRTYALDGLGNWKNTVYTPSGAGIAQTENRTHNSLNQLTQRTNPTTNLGYDGTAGHSNGNLKNDGTYVYTWDAFNRLVQVNLADGGALVAQYIYDAQDRRIRKIVSDIATDFLYTGWRCIEERDGSDSPTVQYVWGEYLDEILQLKTLVPITTGSGATTYPAGVYYPLQDLLYRTAATTNASAAIVEAYDYDAYGNTLIFNALGTSSTWWDANARQSRDALCPFLFTGQRLDPETGLYYYKRRYYSPALGRFLSRDPFESDVVDSGLYFFCSGAPIGLVDIIGTRPTPPPPAPAPVVEPPPPHFLTKLLQRNWQCSTLGPEGLWCHRYNTARPD